MSSIYVDPWLRERIQPSFHARNGMLPSASFQEQVSSLANQITRFRPKQLFSSSVPVQQITEDVVWRFAAHTSPMVYSIVARVLLAQVNTSSADPIARLTIEDGSGTTLKTADVHGGYANGVTVADVPDEFTSHSIYIDASSFQDASVRCTLSAPANPGGATETARIVGCVVYENPRETDTVWGYLNQRYSIGQGIFGDDRRGLVQMALDLWKRGAAPLITYSSITDATAPSTTSGTFANILNYPATPEPAGYWIDLTNCRTKARATVPCRLEAYVTMGPGSIGEVRLVNKSGTVIQSLFCTSTGWVQTTIDMPATLDRYDIHSATISGGGTTKVHAVSLYQYMA